MSAEARRLVGASAVIAFVGGGAISLLAFYVARYGPSGGSWSFRGNGAIMVYTAFAPLMTAGWTALALHAQRRRSWLAWGVGAGAVGLALALVGAAMLPLFGSTVDQAATPVLYIVLLLWMLSAPAWAGRRHPRAVSVVGYGRHVAAGAAWLGGAIAGLLIVGIVIPAGS